MISTLCLRYTILDKVMYECKMRRFELNHSLQCRQEKKEAPPSIARVLIW